MPSASNNNQSSTKLVKQTSVNSVNSGGPSGASGGKGNKKITESTTKSNNTNATTINNNETSSASSVKTTKENTNNVVAAGGVSAASANSKNWDTGSAAGNNASTNPVSKDAGNDALNPMKLTFTTIEHKIRNLEKRKTKLEGYRAIQASGKELSSDQRAAVAKYDAVIATLDFARDLVKQMQQFTKDAEKEQKKQARKDLIAKAQAETVKIREVLIIQNILSCLTDDAIRSDFLSGENGAAKLEPNDMEILEKFCLDVQTRRPETSEDVPFATSAQKAAEVFSMTIDARPKQYGETTYENVKRIFHRIQESDYLDKIYLTDVPEPEVKTTEDGTEPSVALNIDDVVTTESDNQEQEANALDEGMEKLNIEEGNIVATVNAAENALDNGILVGQPPQPQPMPQQTIIKEQLFDMQQQQQQQVALANLPAQQAPTPLIAAPPMAPPATAVPSFQPAASQTGHSGATTPVHVAMYHPSMQQPTAQQIPQMPPAAAIIGGVPTNAAGQIITGIAPQQQVGVQNSSAQSVQAVQQQQQQQQQQQRQMLTSPAAGQAAVAGGPLAALHNANGPTQPPQPGHFNTAIRQHQQYLQQIRPLAEVIGGGNFYFLQDSELDSPDLNNQAVQGVPQNTLVFEQQPPQPNKNTQNLIQEQNMPSPPNQQQEQQQQQQQHQHQLQQVNQQLSLGQPQQQQSTTQTPIQTQTFTNQSFPQMPPLPTQQQPQQSQPSTNAATLVNSNTPSPLFQQQQHQQQQQQKINNTNGQQLFSPVQSQNIHTPQQQQQQQHHHQQQQTHLMMAAAVSNETSQQQQPPTPALMMINRLAAAGQPLIQQQQQQQQQQQMLLQQQITPQNQNLVGVMQQQLPPSSSNNPTGDMSQTPKNSGFPFENPVMAGLNYEQQMQTKLNAEKVLNALQEVSAAATHLHKNELINEWDDAVLKGSTSANSNQQDYKSSTSNVEPTSTKWSAEVNANSPITVQQNQTRKSEWTSSSSSNNANTAETTGGYGNDNRPESNHWHSQDSTGYGRGSSGRGQGGGANTGGGGYQRQRNDDRRDDRRTGGSGGGNGGGGNGGGGYRGRSNYGSGNPQQNGQSRGGGGGNSSGGMYFRNNDNANNNTYYQNGSGGSSGNVYTNKDNRYDSRGGGGGNYRGPRGSDNNSANTRNNGPPPRHMGNRSNGGNSNANNTNSNSYLNSRQSSNRMPLGIENKN